MGVSSVLMQFFFPNRCPFCDGIIQSDKLCCDDCGRNLPFTDLSRCLICGMEECVCYCDRAIADIVSPFYYTGSVRKAIQRYKFSGYTDIAEKLVKFMAEAIEKRGIKADLIIPIPVFSRRLSETHTSLLAKELSKLIGVEWDGEVLVKAFQTKPQHTLKYKERKKNLKNVFRLATPEKIAGKTLLLVDDVHTTGTTLAEAAKALRGSAEIYAVVAASTQRNNLF